MSASACELRPIDFLTPLKIDVYVETDLSRIKHLHFGIA